jgi:hypothetical protein
MPCIVDGVRPLDSGFQSVVIVISIMSGFGGIWIVDWWVHTVCVGRNSCCTCTLYVVWVYDMSICHDSIFPSHC